MFYCIKNLPCTKKELTVLQDIFKILVEFGSIITGISSKKKEVLTTGFLKVGNIAPLGAVLAIRGNPGLQESCI